MRVRVWPDSAGPFRSLTPTTIGAVAPPKRPIAARIPTDLYDSLEARASLSTGSLERVAERAIRAGADLLLLTGRGSYRPVYDHLLSVARTDPVFRARVRESAARVLALKAGAR